MSNAATRITGYVLERLPGEIAAVRAARLRDLAELAASPAEARRLKAEAEYWEKGDERHQQLVLDFKRKELGS